MAIKDNVALAKVMAFVAILAVPNCGAIAQGHLQLVSQQHSSNNLELAYSDSTKDIRGCWTIVSYFVGDAASRINDSTASSVIGNRICIFDTTITMSQKGSLPATYITKKVGAREYLWTEYRTRPSQLGLKADSLAILEIYCQTQKSTEYAYPYILIYVNKTKVYFPIEGVFYCLLKK